MPPLVCFRLKSQIPGSDAPDFDDYVVTDGIEIQQTGLITFPTFEAKLYYALGPLHPPAWGGFLDSGLTDPVDWPRSRSASALLVLRRQQARTHAYFAFTFGPGGRTLLRDDVYERAYGLKAALNLMYPAGAVAGSGQGLRTVDVKRRGATTVRSRAQASAVTSFDVFDVDRLRDVVGGVDGRPVDTTQWGNRISGTDSVGLNFDGPFSELGALCARIEAAHQRRDYQSQFAWLDYIQPVTDPLLVDRLRRLTVEGVQQGSERLTLAPPEIVDWSQLDRFQYPFDRRRRVFHPDLRLEDLTAAFHRAGKLDELSYDGLHDRRISVRDADGNIHPRWNIWSCLTGEIELGGHIYILDEGEFFEVQRNYLAALNRSIDDIPISGITVPECGRHQWEGDYNIAAADLGAHVLLDKKNVQLPGQTAVEICDLLTTNREFVHVKKNSGSSDLSHLFSQAVVSATVMQDEPEFRVAAVERVRGINAAAATMLEGAWDPRTVTVVLGIIDDNWGRPPSVVLPFFSKVNLRRSIHDLVARQYKVALLPIRYAA